MLRFLKNFLPPKRPDLNLGALLSLAMKAGVDIEKDVCIIGVRGAYNLGSNKRAIYDDALVILAPNMCEQYNANTDPGAFRKGIAVLRVGIHLYKIGIHGLSKMKIFQYKALVQDERFTVDRDQQGKDVGRFGINIHKGGYTKVSSIGCQTIYPSQWKAFILNVEHQMLIRGQSNIKYILVDMTENLY